jgi:glucosamine--fructose-6-phosphate aminotransferase (isomerizing)
MIKSLFVTGGALSAFWLSEKRKAECCGIIGILSESRSNISESLATGIELLKNRGYDSAGIVTFHEEEEKTRHHLLKHAEKGAEELNCIERLVRDVSNHIVKAHVGIGHTRWATCGEKVARNAHPHCNNEQSIFIVHNGIIGGYLNIIKHHLHDVELNSETDSEVIVQLLSKFRKQGLPMMEAIKWTEQILKQSTERPQWGVVIMDKDQPDKLWTATNGSPILVGFS